MTAEQCSGQLTPDSIRREGAGMCTEETIKEMKKGPKTAYLLSVDRRLPTRQKRCRVLCTDTAFDGSTFSGG